MNMIYMLLAFSIVIAIIFLMAFLWASNSGQNEDLYTPSVRMLFDDQPIPDKDKPAAEETIKSDEDHART